MATAKQARVPSYRSRAGYSHALVTLTDSATGKRRDYWLGPHGSPESREAYHRVLAEWEANGRRFPDTRLVDVGPRASPPPPARRAASGSSDGHDGAIRTPDLITPVGGVARSSGLTVNDVIHNYWVFAKGYYGASSLYSIKVALRVVRELYGSSPAVAFGPNAIRIVRESMIHGKPEGNSPRVPWARKTVNTRVGNIQRMFRWAASRELIDAGIYHALQTLPPLKRGRSKAVDHEPVKPVPREMVEAVRPFLSRQVAALIDLQLLTGARPGELLRLRACDIDTSSRSGVWTYRPKEHKSAYREKDRALYFGPRAQQVLATFMSERPLDAYLFSPSDAEVERRAKLTANRRTYLSCGNTVGSVVIEEPAHLPGDHYTTASYRRAIERACDLAFPAPAPLCRRELASGRFEGEGALLARLTPCFMMSPLSVAQCLKPGVLNFDLIIMDEASQLRPEDAIGAIARGTQLVVVGDPKQLPPTNFFMGTASDGGDDGPQTAADEQSILDVALSILRPARRLKWHYRSRDASLIAFSNKEFYDSQLVVFPAPYQRHDDFGVRYVHVGEGKYRASVNFPEAQRVAIAAIEHATRYPDRSLGLATLNQPQAELLSLEIDRLAADNPQFEAWRKARESTLEPFFVKNLENVQGDERDAIFISTVYGRDEEGKLFQRFGPINNQGGHRRLNVLFTRAKCQTVVFSSMDPGDIRADESSSWGVRALKGFLQFAKDGTLDVARETDRAPDSPFEVAVAEALRLAGFEAVPQVGVVGYFIDIAVRHPERPGEFVLGVECDGAMYHSSKSARDRDRLRQEVLEKLKWRLHRIWSLDWYRNPRRERDRLVAAVELAIAAGKG